MDSNTKKKLITFLENGQIQEALRFIDLVETIVGTRSLKQNNSMHLWLTMVAEELDKRGFTIQDVVAAIKRAEIRPTMTNLKEVMWRPYQIAALKKESTTKLNKLEVDKVYEGLNKFLGDNFDGLHIPFPSKEEEATTMKNIEMAKKIDYPTEEYKEPLI